MRIADDSYLAEFDRYPDSQKEHTIFLEDHPDIDHYWYVDCLKSDFKTDFKGILNRYDYLSPFRYAAFAERAAERGYEVVTFDDPAHIFEWVTGLSEIPDISLNSDFPGTINGLLPFQVQGYNFCRQLSGSVLQTSTGTGKAIMGVALTKHFRQAEEFDAYFWVVKAHNKLNSARFLELFGDTPSIVIDGDKKTRKSLWDLAYLEMVTGAAPVIVMNYEAFRIDYDLVEEFVTDTKLHIVWDEMPTKLRTRGTQLYKSVCKALFTSEARGVHYPSAKIRPRRLEQVMLSATPIERSPEDCFNAVRIISPETLGSVRKFYDSHVASRNPWGEPNRWKNLDLMGAKMAPITFQVDKRSPDIACQFPEINDIHLLIELSPDQKRLYNGILAEYRKIFTATPGVFTVEHKLSAIQILQYVCDLPLAVRNSALEWLETNGGSGSEAAYLAYSLFDPKLFVDCENNKLEALREIIDGTDSKVVVFSPYNESVIPHLSKELLAWGYDHVTYHGSLSMVAKQAAQDRFTQDDRCKVFLSSDAGSDSINLQVADTVVNYSLPWNWSTLTQRSNRIHRLSSGHKQISVYTFLCADTVEERKMAILGEKFGYHQEVFMGDVNEQAEALRRPSDLEYILFGEE